MTVRYSQVCRLVGKVPKVVSELHRLRSIEVNIDSYLSDKDFMSKPQTANDGTRKWAVDLGLKLTEIERRSLIRLYRRAGWYDVEVHEFSENSSIWFYEQLSLKDRFLRWWRLL